MPPFDPAQVIEEYRCTIDAIVTETRSLRKGCGHFVVSRRRLSEIRSMPTRGQLRRTRRNRAESAQHC